MDEPILINSGLSRSVMVNDAPVRIEIVRLEGNPDWSLEVVDVEGTSIVWQEAFDTETAALAEAMRAIEEEGARLFQDDSNVIPFPR